MSTMSDGRETGGPCAAGVIFALPIEADAFERLATDRIETLVGDLAFHEATLAGRRVAWCVGGIGRARAERAARLLLDGHRPRALVSAGFAGGLDPRLTRGGLVRPAIVRGLDAATGGDLPLAGGEQEGLLLVTVYRIVRSVAEKQALAAATGWVLVDMETFAVATVARDAGLPCYGVRVVSDTAGDDLPAEVGRLVKPQSRVRRLGAVLGALGRRPRTAIDLWHLWERAVVDGRTLAAALAELCRSLPA